MLFSGVIGVFACLLPGLQILHSFGRVVVERRPDLTVRVRWGADPDDVARALRAETERWARIARKSYKEGAQGCPQSHDCEEHGDCCRHCLQCIHHFMV